EAQVLSLVSQQNRVTVCASVGQDLALLNGDAGPDDVGERVRLAQELRDMIALQLQAEREYVDALGAVGTGDKIEKYRRLLKLCRDPKGAESVDINRDAMIERMQEEARDGEVRMEGALPTGGGQAGMGGGGRPEPMDLGVL